MASGGLHKIGRSVDPLRRLEELSSRHRGVRLVHQVPSNDPVRWELYLHNVFAEVRIVGEWFDLTDADVILVRRMLKLFAPEDVPCELRSRHPVPPRDRVSVKGDVEWIARVETQATRLQLNIPAYIRQAVTIKLEQDEASQPKAADEKK